MKRPNQKSGNNHLISNLVKSTFGSGTSVPNRNEIKEISEFTSPMMLNNTHGCCGELDQREKGLVDKTDSAEGAFFTIEDLIPE
jgi:hypothetical protein